MKLADLRSASFVVGNNVHDCLDPLVYLRGRVLDVKDRLGHQALVKSFEDAVGGLGQVGVLGDLTRRGRKKREQFKGECARERSG